MLIDNLSSFVLYLHVEIANLKLGTVGGKTTEEGGRNTRTKVTTYYGSSHKAYLWLLFLEKVHHKGCVRVRGVREQSFCIKDMHLVNTVLYYLLLYTIKTRASNDTFELNAKSIGKLASFCEEFEGNILYLCSLYFAIYKYVIHYPIIFSLINS